MSQVNACKGDDSAFAAFSGQPDVDGWHQEGMTLRQWYAGLAMQGLLACDEYERGLVPEIAYKLADAMIAEGKKQP